MIAIDGALLDFAQRSGYQLVDDENGNTRIFDTRADENRIVGRGDDFPGVVAWLQNLWDQAHPKAASGSEALGTLGLARDESPGTTINGHQYIRGWQYAPDQQNGDPEYAALVSQATSAGLPIVYSSELGYAAPIELAQAEGQITARRKAASRDWTDTLSDALPGIFASLVTAGVASLGAAGVAAAEATTATAASSGAIATDFALVPAGSTAGIGGVGYGGVGLQIPATLGGTASGIGLAATGATNALLSAELLAAAGVETLPGLTAAQAQAAAVTAGIAPPPVTGIADWLNGVPNPSNLLNPSTSVPADKLSPLPKPSTTVFDTLKTATGAVGAAGSAAATIAKLTGSSDASSTIASTGGGGVTNTPDGIAGPSSSTSSGTTLTALLAIAAIGAYAWSS